MPAEIPNPVLPGFHPDPSLLAVGRDYYIATSSFEWWPGVPVYHSRDLADWRLLGYALTRPSQLDMRGNPDSGGVWAPALSYADGRFWLVYSNMRAFANSKDVMNYVVTAEDPAGPWSDPVPLHGRGFDPSLFHDDDGRKWIVSMIWDNRPGKKRFAGIEIQEFIPEKGVTGRPRFIFEGSEIGCTEGPHLMKEGGWYYLILAEGGTGENHAFSLARSRSLEGPYELSPNHPLFTARGEPENPLQKTGHGSIIRTPDGDWYASHLCGRPVGPERRCILGRETAIQKLVLRDDGWFELARGGQLPAGRVPVPAGAAPDGDPWALFEDDFSGEALHPSFNTLREPADPSWLSLRERPGALRLRGRLSLESCFDQSLVARRLHHLDCRAGTEVDFAPEHFQQSAGLALYYNTQNHLAALVTHEDGVRCLRLVRRSRGGKPEAPAEPLPLPPEGPVRLRAEVRQGVARFFCASAGSDWRQAGPDLDATILSDENLATFGFTGTFAALCAQDATGFGPPADFLSFRYEAL